jgi:radical SAM protein with 4Fe4S-binding SPASM domain
MNRLEFPSARVVKNDLTNDTVISSATSDKAVMLSGTAQAEIDETVSIQTLRHLAGYTEEDLPDGAISFVRVSTKDNLQVIQIEALLKCNLTCAYCYCSADKERPEKLSLETIEKIASEAAAMGVSTIDFTGGEFLLRPDWQQSIVAARSRGLTVSLHTNGTALTQKTVDFMKNVGVNRVQVSLDGHTPELHNAIRGGKYSYENTLDGINRLRRAGIPVQVALMIHKANIGFFPEMYAFFNAMKIPVLVDSIAAFGSELNAKTGVTQKEFYEATTEAMRRSGEDKRIKRSLKCGSDLKWKLENFVPACGIGHSYMFITATGEMAICPQLTSREDPVLFGGPNVATVSVQDAWEKSEFFARHRHQNCKNVETCPAGTVCRGGCRADAYAASKGDYRSPDLVECNSYKNPGSKWIDFDMRYKTGDFSLPEVTSSMVTVPE